MFNTPVTPSKLYTVDLDEPGTFDEAVKSLVTKMMADKTDGVNTIRIIGPLSLREHFLEMFPRAEDAEDTVLIDGVPASYVGTMFDSHATKLDAVWIMQIAHEGVISRGTVEADVSEILAAERQMLQEASSVGRETGVSS